MTATSPPSFPQGVLKDATETSDVSIQICNNEQVRKNLLKAKKPKSQLKSEAVYIHPKPAQQIQEPSQEIEVPKDNKIESELVRLTHQLDLLNQAKQLQGRKDMEEHVHQLESQLSKLTEQRLQFLEQMQKQQTEWHAQFLKTLDNVQSNQRENTYESVTRRFQEPANPQFRESSRYNRHVPTGSLPTHTPNEKGTGGLLKEILRDSLAGSPAQMPKPAIDLSRCHQLDLTPVRDTTSAQKPTSSSSLKKQEEISEATKLKELKLLMEREEISRNFPSSISEYLLPNHIPSSADVRLLSEDAVQPARGVAGDCKEQLQKAARVRSLLDQNLRTVQHTNADTALFTVANESLTNCVDSPTSLRSEKGKHRIKKLVDEQIKAIVLEIKENKPVSEPAPTAGRKGFKAAKKAKPILPTSAAAATKKKGTSGVPKPRKEKVTSAGSSRKQEKNPEQRRLDERESTHTYGKAAYHVRRSTVTSQEAVRRERSTPLKFRMDRAVENIAVNHVRSEKVQTAPQQADDFPSFYFDPNPQQNVSLNEAVPGHLIPTAIPMKPPGICDGHIIPIYIPQSPPRPVVRAEPVIYLPTPQTITRPTPPHTEPLPPPVICDPPANLDETFIKENDVQREEVSAKDEPESPDHSAVELLGGAGAEEQPPAVDIASLIKKTVQEEMKPLHKQRICEEETKNWLEQEIMAKILSQLYAAKERETPPCDRQQDFTLAMDPGLSRLDQEHMRELVESEILDIIRGTLGQFELHPGVKGIPQPSAAPDEQSQSILIRQLVTPLPSECGSPAASIKDDRSHRRVDLDTPDLTSESVSVSETSLAPTPLAPVVEPMEPEEPLEQTLVYTPPATPPVSEHEEVPEVVITRSISQPPSEPSEESEKSPSIPDPWEGEFPIGGLQGDRMRPALRPTAVPHEVEEPVVRPVTPPAPARDPLTSSESESSSSEYTSRRDATISDGQLVISHGELKPKFVSKAAAKSLEEAATLVGVEDFQLEEPSSEGELRADKIPRSLPPRHRRDPPRHDPAGVYTRPRHHLPRVTSDEEDLSVGELPPNMSKQRQRFTKWKKSRTPEQRPSPGQSYTAHPPKAPAMDDSTEPETSISEKIPDDVIMVASSVQPQSLDSTQHQPNETLNFADGTDSIIKDSLDGTGLSNKREFDEQLRVRLTLPTAHQSDEQISLQDSDTEDLSVHEL